MSRLLPLLLVLAIPGACRCDDPPRPPVPMGTAQASTPGDAGVPGSPGDLITPLGYPDAPDAPAWTKILVQRMTIDGEERLVSVGWANGIKNPSLAHHMAQMQARTRLLRVAKGQSADSTEPLEGEIENTRIEESFRSAGGAIFVKISGPVPAP